MPARALCVLILLTIAGCNDSGAGKPTGGSSIPSNSPSVSKGPSSPGMARKTMAFWTECIQVNKQFVGEKGELWFKEFRPKAVGDTCRKAARRLRALDNSGVDPEVIDESLGKGL